MLIVMMLSQMYTDVKTDPNVGEDMEELELVCIAGGNVKYSRFGSFAVF